ncbi:MAG: ABC transporter permease [Cyanobacteria bacterium NC_groundwater_1444_Ag_S-0.65um_54_12]|nr:ABC transporter permease [Cyanobacteria bacterium NC_groundwater_1444_Ag_S-0.65um_54_12]
MIREFSRLAIKSLFAYRLRSLLTVLAITIGVAAIIVLVSLAQSGVATLKSGIEAIGGTRFILLFPDAPKRAARKTGNYTKGLTYADLQALKARIPTIERAAPIMPLGNDDKQLSIRRPGQAELHTDVIGADAAFLATYAMTLAAGRNLTPADLLDRSRICVLGHDLKKKLFGAVTALDHEVIMSNVRYRVVGVLNFTKMTGLNFGFHWNDFVLAPLTVLRPSGQIGMAAIISREMRHNGNLIDRANAILLKRHNDVDDFQFLDFSGMLKNFYAIFAGMLVVVGLITGTSIVIGGVGIMNIMLVAVEERRREIGLRKAVGASERAIMWQFLVEAIALGLLGAALGTAIGLSGAWIATVIGPQLKPEWVGVISYPAVALAILAAGSTGLCFGWLPARRAARLDPIDCLRHE